MATVGLRIVLRGMRSLVYGLCPVEQMEFLLASIGSVVLVRRREEWEWKADPVQILV